MPSYAEITGWGKCMPPAILSNDDIAGIIDTSDEWIRSRSGIVERRVSHVPGSDLAAVAGHRALAAAGATAEEVDLLIVATCTPDTVIPSAAAHVQKKMGAGNAAVFDLNAGCTGFLYSLSVATAMIRSAGYRKALVIGAERITWFQTAPMFIVPILLKIHVLITVCGQIEETGIPGCAHVIQIR